VRARSTCACGSERVCACASDLHASVDALRVAARQSLSGSVKEPAYKTLITPYDQVSKPYDPYKRVGLAEPLLWRLGEQCECECTASVAAQTCAMIASLILLSSTCAGGSTRGDV
jgi:hypothetical protein